MAETREEALFRIVRNLIQQGGEALTSRPPHGPDLKPLNDLLASAGFDKASAAERDEVTLRVRAALSAAGSAAQESAEEVPPEGADEETAAVPPPADAPSPAPGPVQRTRDRNGWQEGPAPGKAWHWPTRLFSPDGPPVVCNDLRDLRAARDRGYRDMLEWPEAERATLKR